MNPLIRRSLKFVHVSKKRLEYEISEEFLGKLLGNLSSLRTHHISKRHAKRHHGTP